MEGQHLDLDQILNRLTAAAIDCRGHNVRYRQNQLQRLNAFLRDNEAELSALIARDAPYTQSESEIEVYLSLKTVDKLYSQLNFELALEQEYLVSKGKNNLEKRVPYGIILIRPTTHSRLFSIISPLAAAIAAGNCVLLELPKSLRSVDTFLRTHLTRNLDHDAVAVTSENIGNSKFLSRFFIVDQTAPVKPISALPPDAEQRPVLAIVDRTADVVQAVDNICTANYSYNGESPYAPTVVLVNEWVKEEFVQLCLQRSSVEAACTTQGTSDQQLRRKEKSPEALSGGMSILFESSGIKFLEQQHSELPKKVFGRTVIIMTITSLADSISLAIKSGSALALYVFADSGTSKFLCQNIEADLCFANHIPPHLLVGPAFPASPHNPADLQLRYESKFMSKPHPEQAASSDKLLTRLLRESLSAQKGGEKNESLSLLRDMALTPLKPTGQGSGTSMGFFDQGIMTGLVAFVLPVVCLIGYGSFKAVQLGWRYSMS